MASVYDQCGVIGGLSFLQMCFLLIKWIMPVFFDACRFSFAKKVVKYNHNDMADLEKLKMYHDGDTGKAYYF